MFLKPLLLPSSVLFIQTTNQPITGYLPASHAPLTGWCHHQHLLPPCRPTAASDGGGEMTMIRDCGPDSNCISHHALLSRRETSFFLVLNVLFFFLLQRSPCERRSYHGNGMVWSHLWILISDYDYSGCCSV